LQGREELDTIGILEILRNGFLRSLEAIGKSSMVHLPHPAFGHLLPVKAGRRTR
jgi:hypothetical protein